MANRRRRRLDVIWMFVTLLVAYLALDRSERARTAIQLGMMVSAFVGPFLSGWVTGWLAADGRGPTYGVVGSLGSVLLIPCSLLTVGGVLGLLVAIVALAGGLNGGLFNQSRQMHR